MNFDHGIEYTISPVYLHIIEELNVLLKGNLIIKNSGCDYVDEIRLELLSHEKGDSLTKSIKLIEEYQNRIQNTCSICGNNQSTFHQNSSINKFSHSILCYECNAHLGKEQQALYVYSRFSLLPNVNDKIDSFSTGILMSNSWIWNIVQKFSAHEQCSVPEEELTRRLKSFLTGKSIRFINPINEFDYAHSGNYFFFKDDLYIITGNTKYKDYDEKEKFKENYYSKWIGPNQFLIRALYAGQEINFRGINGEIIFTGDVIKFKGTIQRDRFRKEDYYAEILGPISLSLKTYDGYCFLKPAFLFDMFDSIILNGQIELLGNVFHNLTPNEIIDVNRLVNSWYWDVYDENAKSHILREQAEKNELSKIYTPNFIIH